MATMDVKTADIIVSELNKTASEINYYKTLYNMVSGSKLGEHSEFRIQYN